MWYLNKVIQERFAWTNIFSPEECNQIIDGYLNKKKIVDASIEASTNNINKKYRDSNVYWLEDRTEQDIWIYQKCTDCVNIINEKFFNYDLVSIETLQFTIYNEGQFYKKHVDVSYTSNSFRKLSFTIQLSDPSTYEGGDVLAYYGETPETFNRDIGVMTLFPSNVLHEVVPVTSGVRYSLVGWVTGPRFK